MHLRHSPDLWMVHNVVDVTLLSFDQHLLDLLGSLLYFGDMIYSRLLVIGDITIMFPFQLIDLRSKQLLFASSDSH